MLQQNQYRNCFLTENQEKQKKSCYLFNEIWWIVETPFCGTRAYVMIRQFIMQRFPFYVKGFCNIEVFQRRKYVGHSLRRALDFLYMFRHVEVMQLQTILKYCHLKEWAAVRVKLMSSDWVVYEIHPQITSKTHCKLFTRLRSIETDLSLTLSLWIIRFFSLHWRAFMDAYLV